MDKSPKGVPPSRRDEAEFYRLMRKGYLLPFLQGAERYVEEKAPTTAMGVSFAVGSYVAYWTREIDPKFPVDDVRQWAQGLDARKRAQFIADFKRSFSIDIRPRLNSGATSELVEKTIRESIGLIKTIPKRFHESLTAQYIRGTREAPLDDYEREKIFKKTGRSAGYNLRRITRDQSNKLTGALNIQRLKDVGLMKYKWSTSSDERVRPDHQPREGKIFSLKVGTGIPGDRHPGEAIQCRCVAIPYSGPDDPVLNG